MSAGTLTTTFRVGCRFRVAMAVDLDSIHSGQPSIHAEWDPTLPRKLSGKEQAHYRRGYRAFMQEIANAMGAVILGLESESQGRLYLPEDAR